MSVLELEEMVTIPDLNPFCPVKEMDWEKITPIAPEPVREEDLPSETGIRFWQYRVCGLDALLRTN